MLGVYTIAQLALEICVEELAGFDALRLGGRTHPTPPSNGG